MQRVRQIVTPTLFPWLWMHQFSRSVMSHSLGPHESQHTRPPCPSPTPGIYSNSCLSSRWCHPAILASLIPFSSCPQSLPASWSFPMSQLFTWGGQSIRVSASASVLPMNTQDWSPLGWTGWISLQSKFITLLNLYVFSSPEILQPFKVSMESSLSMYNWLSHWPLAINSTLRPFAFPECWWCWGGQWIGGGVEGGGALKFPISKSLLQSWYDRQQIWILRGFPMSLLT